MKILVVGGTGTIGQSVVNELKRRHEVIIAGSKSGDIHVDISQSSSIENLYKKLNDLDAVVSTVGKVHFGPLAEMTEKQFTMGINNKLMGQINLVLIGQHYLKPKASFTLTSGILNHDPILQGVNAATVNGALEGFVKAAALDLANSMRINLISPTVVRESMPELESFFRGFVSVPVAEVALAYSKSVEGAQTGQVYRVGY